ncbi:Uncharacterised protein [Leminorella grimontii]|nr:Uncharacterised protein [Leminorella grimontii]
MPRKAIGNWFAMLMGDDLMSNIWGVLAKYLNNKNSVVTLDGDFFNMEFEVITAKPIAGRRRLPVTQWKRANP